MARKTDQFSQIISLVVINDKYLSIVGAEAAGRRKWEKASKLNLILKPQ